jgi:hypothetical protein
MYYYIVASGVVVGAGADSSIVVPILRFFDIFVVGANDFKVD